MLSNPTTGEWPAIPPVPAPLKLQTPIATPEPLVIQRPAPAPPPAPDAPTADTDAPGRPTSVASEATTVDATARVVESIVDDDSPTVSIAIGQTTASSPPQQPRQTAPQGPHQPTRRAARPTGVTPTPSTADESPILQLQRSVRRQAVDAAGAGRQARQDLVWQPKFAYTSAFVILFALTVVSMPLWIVLYRITGSSTNNGAGPEVADLVALCMMLLGGFLTGAAAWVIIIEMRGRVRMVDTLAKTGEREAMVAPAAPEIPVLDAPLDLLKAEPIGSGRSAERTALSDRRDWEVPSAPPSIAARAEAQQVSAAATLEASSKLLASFSAVLKSFGQLHAQVAMLTVALALFVGATVLSIR